MNDIAPLSAVEVLVLTRLLPVGEKGETKAKIQKDLEPLLGHRWSGSVLTDVLDRTLIKLVSKGLVAHRPVKSKKAVPGRGDDRRGPPDDPRIPEGEAASHEAETELGQAQEVAAPGPCARTFRGLASRSPRTTGSVPCCSRGSTACRWAITPP